MVTLEQIKLLETKITRAINFIDEVTEENSRFKKRIDELEGIISALREEKSRVEEGIVSALGKLNQFEDAIERSLSSVKSNPLPMQKDKASKETVSKEFVPSPVNAVTEAPVEKKNPAPPIAAEGTKRSLPSAYTIDETIDEEEI